MSTLAPVLMKPLDVDIITIIIVGIKLRCIGSAFGWLRYRRSQQFLVATTVGSFWVAVMAAGFEEGRTIETRAPVPAAGLSLSGRSVAL